MSTQLQLLCSCCGEYQAETLTDLLRHIRLNHADTPNFNIECGLHQCRRTFVNFHTFRNHVYSYHSCDESSQHHELEQSQLDLEGSTVSTSTSQADDTSDPEFIENQVDDEIGTNNHLPSIQKTAALWILKVRECHRIPQSVIESIIKDIDSLYEVCQLHIL